MSEDTVKDTVKDLEDENSKITNPQLRAFYIYQVLQKYSDEEHPLTTNQILEKLKNDYGIVLHRTRISKLIDLLRAAGIEIFEERTRTWNYYLGDRVFSVAELKLLIDAVQSSKFITEKKSEELIEKITGLACKENALALRRTVHVSGRAKSENEKGYYIVDTIQTAINTGRKISFYYYDFDVNKERTLKNDGRPYTVSPFELRWDGDFYYLVGYCDERGEVRVFRVDRILRQPELLEDAISEKPEDYDLTRYTTEVFRMYASEEVTEVDLLCEKSVMKGVIDQFGADVSTTVCDDNHFRVKVRICASPTFYQWVFGWEGKVVIESPEKIRKNFSDQLQKMMKFYD